jgi:ubiquitin carboxyl-terminal hydrolase 25/28
VLSKGIFELYSLRCSCLIVGSLFYGKLRQRVTPLQDESKSSGSTTHTKDDVFSHLPVNVSLDSCDLYDGLGAYFEDTVEFDGQGAQMDVTLVDLPPILQIQLQVRRDLLGSPLADTLVASAI